ncbi:trimeric intracellular cation channel family protein [Algoriphagus sp. CAU 1675]|uniref:trimeric intracellular cation channel family protein n=1 Tax=Algoriphagus sp. CAU 1675 TaxID=3032597 RepID=UPI0023DABE0E|nr:trimeric intracellular cation channel family protein [Algoriphagus sp. CAU 1675]MDF2156376.1 trimeric intracellular cation channel family protein [Algoriphagus sp. CAU 1675]
MTLQYTLELLGTFVFAISGALAIKEKEHDLFGAGFTGFITAIGGGTLRDIFLGSYPLVWIGDVWFLYAILGGVLGAFIFPNFLSKLRKTFFLFDTLGIGFFTVLGVEKALSLGVRPEIAAIMGMFSAVMGGVIRDTLTNEIPILFRKEIYATACLVGAALYVFLDLYDVHRNYNLLISMSVIIGIRLIAMKYKLSLPRLD